MAGTASGGGLNEKLLEPLKKGALAGTGGSAGGGTIAGEGEPSGGATDQAPPHEEQGNPAVEGRTVAAAGELAGLSDSEEAEEAAALGPAEGTLADRAGVGGKGGETLGEAVGSSRPDSAVGAGTRPDKAGLGGGGPGALQGGTGPAGTASPGGKSRE
jgi:hypothetical protein